MVEQKMTRKQLQETMVADSVAHVGEPGDDIPELTARYVDAYGRMDDAQLMREYKYVTGNRVTLH